MLDRNQESLRDRIEELEEENRQFKELLAPTAAFPLEWQLTPTQARLLAALYKNDRLSHERVFFALGSKSEVQSYGLLTVNIHHLRRKLGPLGMKIVNLHSYGYALTPESRTFIKGVLDETDRFRRSLLDRKPGDCQGSTGATAAPKGRTKIGSKVQRISAA